MPGKRYQRSIKNKPAYHALTRKRGMSKTKAARISNAQARGRRGGRRGGRRR